MAASAQAQAEATKEAQAAGIVPLWTSCCSATQHYSIK
jgi:hypothetical protein